MARHPQSPPKSLLRQAGRAIADYQMIRAHDRLLLGVSGGKDSLSLLHILKHLQRHAPIPFTLAAATIDPQIPGFNPSHLPEHYRDFDVEWHYESQPIMEQAFTHMAGDSFCAYCARMKRGILYRLCREQNYNVLVLAQHLDDLAESLLLSLFHGGQLRTMKAHYVNSDGDVRIIRPLIYCRERQTRAYAIHAQLPVVPDNCPACFEKPTRREHVKALLANEEQQNPQVFLSLLCAMRPLLTTGDVTTH
ncbi:tRNA 2-thiocytidine biosynthesis protein TtcA [Rhodoferax sp. 4810]|uniref:tRNA 2-thiocytidine biosynthesis protein TtcA n=1 Tax=Thiospirillum jenense TaxID=1653858 RepID=A0A839HCL4_9GAMM|nr:ATP-binding protein [Thiospirillum jenense]MBB1076324.1 tRNA 2-thiocytidine biosynthesis protein TtcA [Rhodoferax jenense]MBB1126264.1 tRNA 2-thiocytidine biosynthesis protein TtcA [Thiospirillum jenense]